MSDLLEWSACPHCEYISMLLSMVNLVAHEEKQGKVTTLYYRVRLRFGRVVSLTVIWSVETYSKCNHSKYIHNQKNHIQSSAPPPHICTYGE